ncbi:hypothetical protein Y032_0036g3206 [Ancylostoma ceylanicum]|uniref:Uncharacterized protein n=1 Tax=Ancylostoma ceylanicum TaxID=53326 RepID=A0A016UM42_9BILA|nr:hypothetical protein Y032_0036g3206 [Ancylostoma ceylanicum]
MHIAILLFFLILAGHARWLTEEGKADAKGLMNKRSETELKTVTNTEAKKTTESYPRDAMAKSTIPEQHVRRMKSPDDDDDDDDEKFASGQKRLDDDDEDNEQSKARLAKAADKTVIPPSAQFQNKEAASPKIPVRPTFRQAPLVEPSGKVPTTGAPFAKPAAEGAPETRPKSNYYRTKDPLTKNEYIVDEPAAGGESDRSYLKKKLIREKLRKEDPLKPINYHTKEEEDDDLLLPPLDEEEFIIR